MSQFNCRVWGVVVDAAGRVLLLHRNRAFFPDGGWEFCGGGIEAGETPEGALAREYSEECGVEVEAVRLLNARTGERDGKPLLILFYEARYVGGDVRLTNEVGQLEHDDFKWVSREELSQTDLGVFGNLDRDVYLKALPPAGEGLG